MRKVAAFLAEHAPAWGIRAPGASSRSGATSSRRAPSHAQPRCALSARTGTAGLSDDAEAMGFRVTKERVLWRRYQTVLEREVRYPDGRVVSFDVAAAGSGESVFVFPFDTRTQTATLLREYSPGGHRFQAGFVAGMYEPSKHATLEEAARAEMSEEAQLAGGALLPLCGAVQADKYSSNRFHYFLSLDAAPDESPGAQDVEEIIEVEGGVPLGKVRAMVAGGRLNTPSALLAMLALDELRRRGYE